MPLSVRERNKYSNSQSGLTSLVASFISSTDKRLANSISCKEVDLEDRFIKYRSQCFVTLLSTRMRIKTMKICERNSKRRLTRGALSVAAPFANIHESSMRPALDPANGHRERTPRVGSLVHQPRNALIRATDRRFVLAGVHPI